MKILMGKQNPILMIDQAINGVTGAMSTWKLIGHSQVSQLGGQVQSLYTHRVRKRQVSRQGWNPTERGPKLGFGCLPVGFP